MKKHIMLILSLVFLVSASAQAGILIDPYMNYQVSGGLKNGTTDVDTTSTGFGARLGMTIMPGFFIAADYETFSGKTEYASGDVDYSGNTLYATVGFDFPILIRVWAGMAVSGKYDQDGNNTDFKGASGTKIGLAYKFLPFINLYAEMRKLNYDETAAGVAADVDVTSTVVGVAIPISL